MNIKENYKAKHTTQRGANRSHREDVRSYLTNWCVRYKPMTRFLKSGALELFSCITLMGKRKIKKQYFFASAVSWFYKVPWLAYQGISGSLTMIPRWLMEYLFACLKWAPWGDFKMWLSGINHIFFSSFDLIMFVTHPHKAIRRGCLYEKTRVALKEGSGATGLS